MQLFSQHLRWWSSLFPLEQQSRVEEASAKHGSRRGRISKCATCIWEGLKNTGQKSSSCRQVQSIGLCGGIGWIYLEITELNLNSAKACLLAPCVCSVTAQSHVATVSRTGNEAARGEGRVLNPQWPHTHLLLLSAFRSLCASIIVLLYWLPVSSAFCGAVNPLSSEPFPQPKLDVNCSNTLPSCDRVEDLHLGSTKDKLAVKST